MKSKNIYIATFLLSLCSLSIEVLYSRILSVTTWYHLSFFAVSTAMLGMSAGASIIFLRSKKIIPLKDNYFSSNILFFSFSIIISLVILCFIPVDISGGFMNYLFLILVTAGCALPFYFFGKLITIILTKLPFPIGKLYSSDLLGGAFGAVLVLILLEYFDAPSIIILISAVSLISIFLLSKNRKYIYSSITLLILIFSFFIINSQSTNHILKPYVVKGKYDKQANSYIDDRWNSISRVVVYPLSSSYPYLWGPSPKLPHKSILQYFMNIDGDAGTIIRKYENRDDIEHLKYDVTNIGFAIRPEGKCCIIGVGGGKDVHSALLYNYSNITGIDVNKIFIDYLNNRFRNFANIANNDKVTLIHADARSYINSSPEKYSVIQMSLIDTWASTGAGAFSLSENSLYTVDAWKVFLNKLDTNGILSVSRWYNKNDLGETGRIISLAMAALFDCGVKNPSDNILMASCGNISTILVSRTSFTNADIENFKIINSELQFQNIIIPGVPSVSAIINEILQAKNTDDLDNLGKVKLYNFSPPTDESPYFFNMVKISDVFSSQLNKVNYSDGIIAGNLKASKTLISLIICLLVFTIITILLPLFFRRINSKFTKKIFFSGLIYFSLIGIGFMVFEISLIQRLTLFLGNPLYALGILLSVLIASSGLGSFFSEKFNIDKKIKFFILSAIVSILILLVRFLLPVIIENYITSDIALKIFISVILIIIIGFPLGFFFPTGIKISNLSNPDYTPWLWAINGVFSVLSSAVSVFISIYIGISFNFYIAAFCYLLTFIPFNKMLVKQK